MHRSELPRQDVQRGKPPDASLALSALVRRAKRGRGQIGEGAELSALDRVERSVGIGRADGEGRTYLAVKDDRRDHRGVYAHLAREHADRPVGLDGAVARVIAHEHQLAGGDHLPEQRSVRYPPVAARWSRLPESGQ